MVEFHLHYSFTITHALPVDLFLFLKYIYLWVNWRHSQHMGRYQEGKLSSAIISPRALWIWRLSKKRSTNLTLIYSHLTASKVINLSLDRFRRCNYKLKKQQPNMNNSYSDKMVRQLPSTFTAQLNSILVSVKRMHDWEDGYQIKVSFHKAEILRRHGFHFSHTISTASVTHCGALQRTAHFTGNLLCI